MNNNIGDSGTLSLSEALKVNSSLTFLDLWNVFMITNDMNTIVIFLEFHDQPDWFIRSIIIVRRIEGQFIPHSFKSESVLMSLNE